MVFICTGDFGALRICGGEQLIERKPNGESSYITVPHGNLVHFKTYKNENCKASSSNSCKMQKL